MAIRGIANREKHKEDEKNKSPSERSLDLASGDNFKDKSVPQDEKTNHNSNDAATIPEVFDSSKYDSMTEMKESADMNEGGHLKEVLSSLEKEEPIEPTTADTRLSKMNINSPSAAASVTADASPPNLEERAATLRSSRDEQIVDRNLEDSKEKSQEEEIAVKDKAYSGQHLSSNIADPYTIFWRDVAKSWNDFYLEYARSVSDNSILVRFIFKILVVSLQKEKTTIALYILNKIGVLGKSKLNVMLLHKKRNYCLLGFNKENCISSPLLSPIDI